MTQSLLVTGTDTGVGKTLVAGGIAAALVRRGVDVGVMKPFATGAIRVGRRLVSDDARFLQRASGVEDPLELINPICLRPPLAPAMAAEVAGKEIDLGVVENAWAKLTSRHSTMIVEGVGGLLVPLVTGLTVADLARRWKLPLIIVTRPSLGTINHTKLTVLAARSYRLRILGLVINTAVRSRPGLAELLNPAALVAETGVPLLAEIPFLPRGRFDHPAFDRIAARLLAQ